MRTAYEALGMCPLYRHMADRRNEAFPSGSMAQGIARNATLEKQNASRTKHGSQDFAESGRVCCFEVFAPCAHFGASAFINTRWQFS